jgi:hypothetical protein
VASIGSDGKIRRRRSATSSPSGPSSASSTARSTCPRAERFCRRRPRPTSRDPGEATPGYPYTVQSFATSRPLPRGGGSLAPRRWRQLGQDGHTFGVDDLYGNGAAQNAFGAARYPVFPTAPQTLRPPRSPAN